MIGGRKYHCSRLSRVPASLGLPFPKRLSDYFHYNYQIPEPSGKVSNGASIKAKIASFLPTTLLRLLRYPEGKFLRPVCFVPDH